MPEEIPTFTSKTVTAEPDEKPKKAPRKRTPVRRPKLSAAPETTIKEAELSKQLTYIYRDENGKLPDMRKIAIKKKNRTLRFFTGILLVGSVLAAAAWAGFFFFPGMRQATSDQLSLSVSGSAQVTAGVTSTHNIVFKNETGVALKQAVVNVQYPQGFVFVTSSMPARNSGHSEWVVGDIAPYQKREIAVSGIWYGSLQQEQSWRIFMRYQPENLASQLQQTAVFAATITDIPYLLRIAGPEKAAIGGSGEYTFLVDKETDANITALEVAPNIPEGFVVESVSPAFGKNNTWTIDPNKASNSSTPSQWKLQLVGRFSSSSSANAFEMKGSLNALADKKTFFLSEAAVTTELARNDLDFKLAINGTLDKLSSKPGDMLNITLYLKNLSANDFKNATVKLTLDAPSVNKQSILDWPKITDDNDGTIKGTQIENTIRRGEITWNKEHISTLAGIKPDQDITIDLRLPVRDSESFDLAEAAAHQIKATAEVAFFNEQNQVTSLASNPIIITLNSDLSFDARDVVSKSGDSETHAVTWILNNTFHALKNVTVSAEAYGNVSWTGNETPPAGNVAFQDKKVTWTIPEIPEGVDVLALPFTLTISGINPTQNLLMSKAHIQAEDAVTGEKLDFFGEEIRLNQ